MVKSVVSAVGVLAAAAAPPVWRVEPTAEGVRIIEMPGTGAPVEQARLPLGEVRDVAVRGPTVYVALAAGGVVIVSVDDPRRPEVVGRLADGRAIDKLMVAGDLLILLEPRQEAIVFDVTERRRPRPLGPTSLAGPVAASAAGELPSAPAVKPAVPAPSPQGPTEVGPSGAPPPPVLPEGRVVGVEKGRAIFDVGVKGGIKAGMRVRVAAQRLVEKPDLVSGGTRQVPSGETTAVVPIEHAEEARSMAQLGRGDVAEPGDRVAVTAEGLSERLWLPRRAPFTTRFGFHVRPFLGLGQIGKPVGVLVDAVGSYYLDTIPARFEAQAAPAGTVLGGSDPHYPVTTAITAAYASDYFEIGLGFGALVGVEGPCFLSSPRGAPTTCEENTGVTFNQVLRLGSLDGLNVTWQSSIFSRPNQFVFGVGRGEFNVPLSSRLGVFGAGGGGENGWAFGEFGVRTYVGGAGARGTVIVSASLGGAAILDGPSHEVVAGPAVAFGMEWRL